MLRHFHVYSKLKHVVFVHYQLVKRIGLLPLLQFGSSLQLTGVVLILLMAHSPVANIHLTLLGLFLAVAAIGFTSPNATALALANQRERAGMASALLGSVQFAIGLFAGFILYHLDWNIQTNMSVVMLGYVLVGLICVSVLRLRAKKQRKTA